MRRHRPSVWGLGIGMKSTIRPFGSGRNSHVWPGARTVHTAELERSHGWYDLAVATDDDHLFLRRLAGHVETGRPSTSDPAIATG